MCKRVQQGNPIMALDKVGVVLSCHLGVVEEATNLFGWFLVFLNHVKITSYKANSMAT